MTDKERYRLGMSAFSAGNDEQAIALLSRLAADRNDQQAALCRHYLGRAYYRLGIRCFETARYSDAARQFQKAASLKEAGESLIGTLAVGPNPSATAPMSVARLERTLQAEPGNVRIRIQLALAHYREGHAEKAAATLREGLDYPTPHADLHYELGVLAIAGEDYLEAQRAFERAILANPRHAPAHERLAQLASLNHDIDRALTLLERAHALDPHNARIALQLSVLAQGASAAGRPTRIRWQDPGRATPLDEADLDRLTRAITAEPDFVEAFLSLPKTEVDREVFSMLAAILQRALRAHPEYADLHCHCGAVYQRLDRPLDAIHHTERAVAINPRYVDALVQLARLYGQTEQWVMAVERLEQAIRAGADYPDVHALLGKLSAAGGQRDRAQAAYRRARELSCARVSAQGSQEIVPA